jgi:hypothetical protein
MSAELQHATAAEADRIRRFMAAVIATSLGNDEGVLADTITNVNANVDFWLKHPGQCVHIVATDTGPSLGSFW